jgi:ABC-2 type transport system permease protein
MATNIFRQEFKMLLRSIGTWTVSIAAVIFVFTSLFSSFAAQAEALKELMDKFPPALLTAFGLTGVDLSTPLGFFGFLYIFVQLSLAIQAAGYGFGLVSVEEREWTADFLLSKPITRGRVLTSKLLAALAGLLITNLTVWVSSFVFINLSRGDRPYDAGNLAMLLASILPFQLAFLGLGLVISLLVKRIRSVIPYSMGLGFGMYVLSVFSDMLGESFLETVTPFKHFEPNYILQNGAWDWPLAAISFAVIVISIAGSYLLYNRRDIPAVA